MAKSSEQQQRCCLGLLYYSRAMQAEGEKPVCLGVSHAPAERIQLEENRLVREQHGFRFVCLGNSLYEPPTQQGSGRGVSAEGHVQSLPYCEGLEVLMASTMQDTAAAGSSGRQTEEWSAVLSSMMGGENSAVVRGVARFNKIAARNWERMKATANQAYTVTVKPLMDRLSGDQQQ